MTTTLHPPRPHVPRTELVVPALAVLVAALAPLAVIDRLPDPVAIHWGIDGRPDGSGPLLLDAVLIVVATALVTLLPLWAAARADRRGARLMVAIGHAMAGLFVLLRLRTLQLNLDAPSWQEAGPLTLGDLGLLVLVALSLGVLGWWLGGRHPEHVRVARPAAVPPLPPDGRLVWVGRQAWGVGRALGPVLVVAGGLLSGVRVLPDALLVGGVLGVSGLLVWAVTSITVAVGPPGLRVRFGPLGWPRIAVAVADVEHVEVEDVEPLAYGGWGYRALPGVRAVVIRWGPGLRVTRRGRPDLIVTVDDAATAAGVLAAHVAAHRDGGGTGEGPQ